VSKKVVEHNVTTMYVYSWHIRSSKRGYTIIWAILLLGVGQGNAVWHRI